MWWFSIQVYPLWSQNVIIVVSYFNISMLKTVNRPTNETNNRHIYLHIAGDSTLRMNPITILKTAQIYHRHLKLTLKFCGKHWLDQNKALELVMVSQVRVRVLVTEVMANSLNALWPYRVLFPHQNQPPEFLHHTNKC